MDRIMQPSALGGDLLGLFLALRLRAGVGLGERLAAGGFPFGKLVE